LTRCRFPGLQFFHKSSKWLPDKEQKNMSNNKPAFEAFVVRKSNNKSFFTKIGAAWPTKSGNGFLLDLVAMPVDGKVVLLPPKEASEVTE
jgi:hypothetical protein